MGPRLRFAVVAACLVQFMQLFDSPSAYIPTQLQKQYAQEMNQKIASLPGEVYVIHNVVDAGSAGKATYANSMAVWDVLRADHGPAAQNLRSDLMRSFEQKEFSAILSDAPPESMMPQETPYLNDINHAAAVAYPVDQRTMPPVEQMLFFTSPQTPDMKPNVLFLPANPAGR